MLRWIRSFILTLLASACFLTAAARAQDKVDVKVVKYTGLTDTIKQLKGKVVVVDFWSDTCIPCKKSFPHLVEMHQKLRDQGLAAVSVSLDDPQDAAAHAKVVKFLQMQKATFTNLILDEKPELYQEKLRFQSIPCVFVFDRNGKWTKFEGDFEFTDVDRLVMQSLKEAVK